MNPPRIPLAGIIGAPVARSLAPKVFGHWLQKHGLLGHYIPMEIAAQTLESSLRALPALGFVGVHVAAPYRDTVLDIADLISDRATLIGAANTLIFRADGRIHADNTDGYGFIENLRKSAPDWDPQRGAATVFGAGGAARAVIASLLDVGVPEIRLTNRTRLRAEKLRGDFGNRVRVHDWVKAGNLLEGCATVVNTTSLGMTGKPPLRVPLDGLRSTMVVADVVHQPFQTPFLAQASAKGCTVADGLGMLLHQAVPGFERWFGIRPEVDSEIRAAVSL